MIYSPHTFELSIHLTQAEYETLRASAYDKAEDSHRIITYTDKSGYYDVHADMALISSGIRIEYHDNFLRSSIRLIVNPSRVLGSDDIPKLWKPTDRNIKALLRELKALIKDYFDSEYKLNDFKLTRIDFTVNIDVGSRENVSQYIKILHSMGRVKGFAPKYKKSNKRIKKALSFDLKGNTISVEFSAYDKEAQSNMEAAKGILRIEIRLMKFRFKEKNVSAQIKTLSKSSREVFMKFFQRIVPRGNYYSKKQAITLIKDNITTVIPDKRARGPMLEKMEKLIELIPVKKSLILAQNTLCYRHIDRVMETFAALNVSPVIIPKSTKLKYLESLYSYLE